MQADLKRLYYLWQIYHIKKEMSSAQAAAGEQFGELREAAVQLQATEKQIEQLRKQQAGFNKDAVKQEHQMKRRRADFEKQVPASDFHCPSMGLSPFPGNVWRILNALLQSASLQDPVPEFVGTSAC